MRAETTPSPASQPRSTPSAGQREESGSASSQRLTDTDLPTVVPEPGSEGSEMQPASSSTAPPQSSSSSFHGFGKEEAERARRKRELMPDGSGESTVAASKLARRVVPAAAAAPKKRRPRSQRPASVPLPKRQPPPPPAAPRESEQPPEREQQPEREPTPPAGPSGMQIKTQRRRQYSSTDESVSKDAQSAPRPRRVRQLPIKLRKDFTLDDITKGTKPQHGARKAFLGPAASRAARR